MSRTIIPSSTVSDMQVGKNVNLRLLDNAPISMQFFTFLFYFDCELVVVVKQRA